MVNSRRSCVFSPVSMNEPGTYGITVFPGFGIGPELLDGLSVLFDAFRYYAPPSLCLSTCQLRAEGHNNSAAYCRSVLSEIRTQESLGVAAFIFGPHPANVLSELRCQLNILFKHQAIGAYTTRSSLTSPLKRTISSGLSLNLYRICVPSVYSSLSRRARGVADTRADSTKAILSKLRLALKVLKTLCPVSRSVFLMKYDYDMLGQDIVRKEMGSYVIMNPDTGLVRILDNKIRNVICMDLEGDIIGDILEYLVNGTKNVGYAVNCGASVSRYYQTLHGEAHDLVGSGSASPIAMMRALSAAIRQDKRFTATADNLDRATESVYRRQGIVGQSTLHVATCVARLFIKHSRLAQ